MDPRSDAGTFCAICERTLDWDGHSEVPHLRAEVERLKAALRDCAQIADDATHACVTDEERDIAITIRNLILSRYPESRKALKGER